MFALRFKDGTRHAGNLVGVSASSNGDAEFCGDVEYSLCRHQDNVWVVSNRAVAEAAAVTDTEWYNASYETPCNDYVGQLEVVELKLA